MRLNRSTNYAIQMSLYLAKDGMTVSSAKYRRIDSMLEQSLKEITLEKILEKQHKGTCPQAEQGAREDERVAGEMKGNRCESLPFLSP